MSSKRKTYSAEFKTKVALETIGGELTTTTDHAIRVCLYPFQVALSECSNPKALWVCLARSVEQLQGLLLDPALPLLLLVEKHLGCLPEVLADMDKVQEKFEIGKTRLHAALQGRIPIA